MQASFFVQEMSLIQSKLEDGLDFYLYLQSSLEFNFWRDSGKDILNDFPLQK